MDRRQFSTLAGITLAAQAFSQETSQSKPQNETYTVGVIGHTGRGNFGHGLDGVWNRIEQTTIVCVADENEAGLRKASKKLKLQPDQGFANYHMMLSEKRPDIVAVCPRFVDERHGMMMAAIQSGAKGIYVEKPFVSTPRQADDILAACKKSNTKIAVAHRNRFHPVLKTIDRIIEQGHLGRLLEIRGRGKSDRRGGVEDLWVLGSHVLNLITYFGGNPLTCSGTLLKNGSRTGPSDIVDGNEGIGKVAGNELHARFLLQKGVMATFDSVANDGTHNHGFGLRLIGSEGQIDIKCDKAPLAHFLEGNPFEVPSKPRVWQPITTAGIGEKEPIKDLHNRVYSHEIPARELINVMETDREASCDAKQGAQTVEMICAVMLSHVRGKEVSFPLDHRDHPLSS